MLTKVDVERRGKTMLSNADDYRLLVGEALIDELEALADDLRGVRICHINSTAIGGGVAELLIRYLPLMRALGVEVDWRLIHGHAAFYNATKTFHNTLQGAAYDLLEPEQRLYHESIYLEVNEQNAKLFDHEYDLIIVHDPQPAALRHYAGRCGARWIWRCHIDSSTPNDQVSAFFHPYISEYDAVVFTMPNFLLPGLEGKPVDYIPPAIDPFATKNMELPLDLCKQAITDYGIDIQRPLLVQVSRFDPWKDPMGVMQAYRLVKANIPDVQLALIGPMAGDDPEGWHILQQVEEAAAEDGNMFVFTNLGGAGSMEVNVFQRCCDVIIQKSLREGFGLVVAEALWKERPVVAGNVGGIPMQVPTGFESYLVDSVEACAERIAHLLAHPGERGDFGRAGREHVRREFLMPRLVRDHLRLARKVLASG